MVIRRGEVRGGVGEQVERAWHALRRQLLLLLLLLLLYRRNRGVHAQVLYGRVAGLLREQIRIDEVRDRGSGLWSPLRLHGCVCARSGVGGVVPVRIVLVLIQMY